MSRIGKKLIEIPEKVSIEVKDGHVTVKGPKGEITKPFSSKVLLKIKDNTAEVSLPLDDKESYALWGLTRAFIVNMIDGVVKGFEKKLELVGVGFRATQKDASTISMTLGFSHPVEYTAPSGVELKVEDSRFITISGIDKEKIGLVASNIRKIRKPEPYKGKGIKYSTEVVRRKPGKTGKA